MTNEAGAIAAGCGAICCTVLFFLLGIPMIIASAVLFSISNGNYDDYTKYEVCDWYEGYDADYAAVNSNCTESFDWWYDDCEDCSDLHTEYKNWETAKDNMRIAAIVMIVIAGLMVVGGVVLVILMCTSLCKKGTVHQPAQTVVFNTTVPSAQGYGYPVGQGYAGQPNQVYGGQPNQGWGGQPTQGYGCEPNQGYYPGQPQVPPPYSDAYPTKG